MPFPLPHLREAVTESNWYADPENYDLRQALAQKHAVDIDEICVDAGIDSLLGLTVRMLLEPGQTVVTSHGAYPTLNYHVAGFGAKLKTVPYKEFHEDPQALISASAQSKAKLVYLSNPDNPMGTWHEADVVSKMIASVPGPITCATDRYQPPGCYSLPDILKSLRHGRATSWLCNCAQRYHYRL